MRQILLVAVVAVTALVPVLAKAQAPAAGTTQKSLDVIYVPTPPEVVSEMLKLAGVRPGDVVYDLGSGDGRVVIAAVRDFGAALFESDFSEASVVAVYLLPQLLQRLVPAFRALKPGTRIVSHNYDMGAIWPPDRTLFESDSLIHFWRVPQP